MVFSEIRLYMNASIPDHIFTVAKRAVDHYVKRVGILFVQNPEGTIPRTNNGMGRFFLRIRRNVRKRYGNIYTGNTGT